MTIAITVSIHCAPEMSEIDCIGRIESFWPKFVRGWYVFWHVFLKLDLSFRHGSHYISLIYAYML